MRITTDNPGDNTRMRATGTTILTITLDTDHDRNGALQTCNSHTVSNGCGAATASAPLDMFSYTLALKATGGTVIWGTFSASDAAYTNVGPTISNSTEIEINQARPLETFTPPGLTTIGTLPVTPTSGSPAIGLQIGPGALDPFEFGTGFGTLCDAFSFPNTYVVGNPADPCGNVTGFPGDWFDWDGAAASCLGCESQPVILAPATASATEGVAMAAINATATDADAGNTLTITQSGMPADLTFTTNSPGPSPRTASIAGTPGFGDAGTYDIVWTVNDGTGAGNSINTTTTVLTVGGPNRAPVLNPIADMTVTEGMTGDQTITAGDADGSPITFSKVAGPIFMSVTTTAPGTGSASGNIHLAPGLADAGTYTATVRASAGSLTDDEAFRITALTSGNRCPVANAGGPYTGLVASSLGFDGRASFDPDGNPLTYAWDFDASDGITVDAVGAFAGHVYSAGGSYAVTLTVTDDGDGDPAQVCSNSATTAAVISPECPATVFNGYDTIRLGSGKPIWFAYVQTFSGCFSNPDVVLSSFVMEYAGRQVPAEVTKTTVDGDKNGDGIPEIRVSFSKPNLRTLFGGLPIGHTIVAVSIKANTVIGRTLVGATQLEVVNNGNFTASEVAPNPLNPEATLTYTITRQGPVRIDMFDIQGRLVRRIADAPAVAAGTHDVKIDGRGERGEKLPSGVYYIRGTSCEGAFKHLITILK
jgi:hypothetical protein